MIICRPHHLSDTISKALYLVVPSGLVRSVYAMGLVSWISACLTPIRPLIVLRIVVLAVAIHEVMEHCKSKDKPRVLTDREAKMRAILKDWPSHLADTEYPLYAVPELTVA